MVKVLALGCLTVVPLQSVAHAVIPPQHSAGSDGHEFAYTGEYTTSLNHTYKPASNKFTGKLGTNFVDPVGLLEDAADADLVCVEGRKVEVFKARRDQSDKLMGSDRTNSTGTWAVSADVSRGKYYASVSKSEILIREYYNGIDFYAVCKSASSTTSGL